MRAVLVGSVESSRIALEALGDAADWTVAGVVSLRDALSGRHSDFVDMAAAAKARGARPIQVANVNDPEALSAIRDCRPDYLFVIGWSQICGPDFRAIAPGRTIGYHPAALPRMRGRAAIPWTILADEKITAGSLFWIDGGTDTGALLDQAYFHVAPGETAATLYAKHMRALREMLARTLPVLARGEEPRREQDEDCATWCARRTAADGRIDWTRPASQIARLVRAVGRPYPGAWTCAGDNRLTIWSARECGSGERHLAGAGQVISREENAFTVSCGNGGALRVEEWESTTGRMPGVHVLLGEGAASC
ncbi:methionyl-tRNA formyltransferase [Aurantiacibacter spongiae]|uniref:Methionyl-tRNA formyltransferase n=1 Tax=Aurantiacibacter spongiae TaxID=2488860 RepID=A0A3N5CQ74_9SPHN|nr:formyltransferase family protein [Aurantiacibacter spongiae]RPF71174.1 methionyl-tRNA formyltransferase [Aurantiacibacter spongiae]